MKLINRDRNRGFTISQCYVWSCERHFLKKKLILCVCVWDSPQSLHYSVHQQIRRENKWRRDHPSLKVWAPVLVIFRRENEWIDEKLLWEKCLVLGEEKWRRPILIRKEMKFDGSNSEVTETEGRNKRISGNKKKIDKTNRIFYRNDERPFWAWMNQQWTSVDLEVCSISH